MKYLLFISIVFVVIHKYLCLKDIKSYVKQDVISDEEYYKLPELFVLENYERCMSQRDGVYCLGAFDLVPTTTSAHIYDTLLMLTNNTLMNFNHTVIHRGVCIRGLSRCSSNTSATWHKSFEECVNNSIQSEYGLQAKLSNVDYCKKSGDVKKFDSIDYLFIVYAIAIISLNIIGTAVDMSSTDKADGNPWLLAFSLRRNWRKLIDINKSSTQFECFYGLRVLLSVAVHIAHATVAMTVTFLPNTRYLELAERRPVMITGYNATVIVQIFILMSCFLRTINILNLGSKTLYKILINNVIDRYARVGPLFVTMVGLSATLLPYVNDGPLWTKHVDGEAALCRNTFWRQLLFLQNSSPPGCIPQAWYLSVDFQMSVITTIITVYVMKYRKHVMEILFSIFTAAILFVFALAYVLELKPGVQFMKPENLRTLFNHDKSFILLYQSPWGNLPSATIGIAAALLYRHIKDNKYELRENKLFVMLYKLSIPAGLIYLFLGGFLYNSVSRLVVSSYATLDKPGFSFIMAIFILGCIFKIDDTCRNVVEWKGWVVGSRLTLAALLLHGIVNKLVACGRLYPLNMTLLNIFAEGTVVSVFTYILSIPLCLLIEYPFIELYKIVYATGKRVAAEVEVNSCNNIKTKNE